MIEIVEKSFEALKGIKEDFKKFQDRNSYITEADTRVNLIDRIINEVLLWPPNDILREPRSENGYLDYLLKVNGKKFICVEAKKEGITFNFPKDKKRKYYKISGSISSDTNVMDAVSQVRTYCDESAIRYAVATNGTCWIVFRAIREDLAWKEGSARVFHSLEDILECFLEFWNLLSFECINQGSLDLEFSPTTSSNRELSRVLSYLISPDVPLLRNSLHTELHPIISHFFEDIADPEYIETLENCYVYSTSIKTVANDINFVIKDAIPKFLEVDGAVDVIHQKNDAGIFGKVVERAVRNNKGQLFLLLGGIGSGKTTFQKRYQLTVGRETLLNNSIWFSIDFLKPPSIAELENFVWHSLLNQLRSKYETPHLETRQNIKRIFKVEIEALTETSLYNLKENTKEYDTILNEFLAKWQANISEYVPRLLAISKPKRDLNVVLFFDNVDQLSQEFQAQIFLLAQSITDKVKSITIIALREESYYAASVQKVFTAYINRKFHIASPPFRKMIGQRIKFVLKIMDNKNSLPTQKFKEFRELADRNKISDFLKIVEFSIFEKNRNIARFIDHLCFGNMRVALQMFSTFLVSGATDVDKMLRIYRRDGNYFVPFHEFLRSIMLGERYYYKDSYSTILNVFECGQEKNSSHFTSLRILSILNIHRSESSKLGDGFYEINKILSIFEDIFNNKQDFLKSLLRLVARQLVETNTKIIDSISSSTHIRITSSGWYYLKFLINSFAYLDLVFQDTPINDLETVKGLFESMKKVNNLGDPEEDKISRMEERFSRVGIFLNYLQNEENDEIENYYMKGKTGIIFSSFVPSIIETFMEQKKWISRRVKENKEKYDEEYIIISDSDIIQNDQDDDN